MREGTPPPVHAHYSEKLTWKVVEHPPHCPDVAPSACHWFMHLTFLTDQRLRSDQETIDFVQD
jgi:hypothetical protein